MPHISCILLHSPQTVKLGTIILWFEYLSTSGYSSEYLSQGTAVKDYLRVQQWKIISGYNNEGLSQCTTIKG